MLVSYLKVRLQYNKISKVESAKSICVKCGVQQGPILGPLLFIIYLNDIPSQKSNKKKLRLFFMLTIQLVFIKGGTETAGMKHDATLAAVASWCHKKN